ncbi:MAG: hypothetical protein IH840_15605 [Candidatus Heimdallarchaeota archaeon]|nr:hypothetical protein [Candidatus Heimdallarchaeota archaeon]
MTFAIELEKNLEEIYQIMARLEQNDRKRNEYSSRMRSSQKRKKNLERSRRENVTEITLEPIEGLSAIDYSFEVQRHKDEVLDKIEFIMCQFYRDAGPKINVLESRRVFSQNLKEHENTKSISLFS